MVGYPRHANEVARLTRLRSFHILDTPPEPAFDRITTLAARLFDVPIALLVMVDEDRQWFKSRHGLDVTETPRQVAFCTYSILSDDVLVVEDALLDPRFAGNPLVTGAPFIRFYAGAPLHSGDHLPLGTLALFDRVPRVFGTRDREILRALARVAMDEVERRPRAPQTLLSLEDSDPRLRLLLEQLPAVLWSCDRELRVTSMSGSLIASRGFDRQAIIGRPLAELVAGREDRPTAMAASRRALAGDPVTYEVRWSGIDFHAHVAPLRDAQGHVVGTIGIGVDVSDSRRIEGRLRQAERLAAIGMLAAGAAHEINNPLSVIGGNLALAQRLVGGLIDRAGDGDAAALRGDMVALSAILTDAGVGAARVQRIVQDLRTFARGDVVATRHASELNAVLEAALTLTMNQIRDVARLERHLAPVPPVALDDARLAQVCLNLLFNAAQAIPEGSPGEHTIQVATFQRDDVVVLEVCDSGRGIPEGQVGRIFEPFFTTKPTGKGTGLGLSIVRGIVEEAGGRVEADRDARGTVFRVELPVAREERVVPPIDEPAPAERRRRILVVDDEPLIARLIENILEPEHEIVSVSNGRDADALLAVDPEFDLILCDLNMADMNGVQLHAAVSARQPEMAARMVFMTGGAFNPNTRRFLEEIGRPVLTKPFELEALERIVRTTAVESPPPHDRTPPEPRRRV